MRIINLLITLFFIVEVFAQDSRSIQNEIDSSLWRPFKIAFETLNAEKLNALYGKNVLRVTPNAIDTENSFKVANLKRFEENLANKASVKLDFWFDSRHTNKHTSYEVGLYRMQLINVDSESTVYGQFHIVLKKIKDQWRIVQDWDSTSINGNPITAIDFEKQKPLRFE